MSFAEEMMENKKYYYVFIGGADTPIECNDANEVEAYLLNLDFDIDLQDVTVVLGNLQVLVPRILPGS